MSSVQDCSGGVVVDSSVISPLPQAIQMVSLHAHYYSNNFVHTATVECRQLKSTALQGSTADADSWVRW